MSFSKEPLTWILICLMSSDLEKEDRISNLLLKGHEYSVAPSVTDENMAQEAINLFSWCAENRPGFLVGQMLLYPSSFLAPLATAILICKSPEKYFEDKYNKGALSDVFTMQDPNNLLEVVKFLKSKVFGSGLGSKIQKMLRTSMEGWSTSTLEQHCKNYPKSVYGLTRLIHPRFKGEKGLVIRRLLDSPPNK